MPDAVHAFYDRMHQKYLAHRAGMQQKRAVTCGYCENCKWWNRAACEADDPWAYCTAMEHDGKDSGHQPGQFAWAQSADGLAMPAFVLTHAAFGCVQWEAKNA